MKESKFNLSGANIQGKVIIGDKYTFSKSKINVVADKHMRKSDGRMSDDIYCCEQAIIEILSLIKNVEIK